MLHSLNLAATSQGWRLFSIRKEDKKFEKFYRKVLERDQYTCQFCGFQSKQHQEVINLDNDYLNNKLNNLITTCCFCAQCFFLEAVGKNEYGGGLLIYLPELTQNELNGLCHVLFCAMANATQYQVEAQNIYRTLTLRSKIIEKYLGENMSNPAMFGMMLIDAQIPNRQTNLPKVLESLRLLPTKEKFAKQINDWAISAKQELAST